MTPPLALLGLLAGATGTPGPVTRDGARREAHDELSRRIYAEQRPGLVTRLLNWVGDRLSGAWDATISHVPGRGLGTVGLVAVLVVVATVIRFWLGPVRGQDRAGDPADALGTTTEPAARLRERAERLAAEGAWAEAVRARLRAAVRSLEERGLVEPRPGRTLGELETAVTGALPTAAESFAAAARAFADIWYGDRPAGQADYRVVAAADEALSRSRPVAEPAARTSPVVPS